MDNYSIHHNETIFPDSHTFNPDRWLVPTAKGLDRFLVSFSSGTRQCLGTKLTLPYPQPSVWINHLLIVM